MGCGGSKPKVDPEIERPRPKTGPATQSGRVAHSSHHQSVQNSRPHSQSHGSKSSSGRNRSSSGRNSRAPSRRQSAHGRPLKPPSRNGASSAGQRIREGIISQVIDEEIHHSQPAEDSSIIFDFGSLRTYIQNHALNYYRPEQIAAVRQIIAKRILELVIAGRSADLRVASSALLSELQGRAIDPTRSGGNHLGALFNSGAKLVGSIRSNPAKWTIGPWERNGRLVVYPSILRNGQEVVKSEAA